VVFSPFAVLLFFTALAVASAVAGVLLSSMPEFSRKVIPFSGAILILISVFGILPELTEWFGGWNGAALMASGVGAIFLVDRFVYPVCPTCAHSHDHDHCSTRLHGFATPIIAATLIHSLFDGWALVAGSQSMMRALSLGVMLHKLPEGLACGVILRAALRSRRRAVLWATGAQLIMLVGGALEPLSITYFGNTSMLVLLALGGGMFLYLGLHAIHGEWKRRVAASARP
jgi:zinc transporter ZupT